MGMNYQERKRLRVTKQLVDGITRWRPPDGVLVRFSVYPGRLPNGQPCPDPMVSCHLINANLTLPCDSGPIYITNKDHEIGMINNWLDRLAVHFLMNHIGCVGPLEFHESANRIGNHAVQSIERYAKKRKIQENKGIHWKILGIDPGAPGADHSSEQGWPGVGPT